MSILLKKQNRGFNAEMLYNHSYNTVDHVDETCEIEPMTTVSTCKRACYCVTAAQTGK